MTTSYDASPGEARARVIAQLWDEVDESQVRRVFEAIAKLGGRVEGIKIEIDAWVDGGAVCDCGLVLPGDHEPAVLTNCSSLSD